MASVGRFRFPEEFTILATARHRPDGRRVDAAHDMVKRVGDKDTVVGANSDAGRTVEGALTAGWLSPRVCRQPVAGHGRCIIV